jgi:hypothetical protein
MPFMQSIILSLEMRMRVGDHIMAVVYPQTPPLFSALSETKRASFIHKTTKPF